MSTQATNTANLEGTRVRNSASRRRLIGREVAYLAIALLPAALLAGLLAVAMIGKQVSQARLDAAIVELAADGQPVGNHSLTVDFDRRTEPATSREWREVFGAIRQLEQRFSPLILEQIAEAEKLVPPDQPWAPVPLVEKYVRESEPIVRRIERLTASPKPVWQPLILDGFTTQFPELQEARRVPRLLQHHFRLAFHDGDHESAMRAIELAAGVPDAFDWRIAILADLIHFALQHPHRKMVRESLPYDFWTAEELRRLDSLLQRHENFDARWRQAVAAERALILADTEPTVTARMRMRGYFEDLAMLPFGVPAGARLAYVRRASRLQLLRNAGTKKHVRKTAEVQQQFKDWRSPASGLAGFPLVDPTRVTAILAPDWVPFSRSFVRQAVERRWTRCAVAIKRFQLQHDRWPESLEELRAVGLSPADWQSVEGVPFGYQISKDGEEAFLWTIPPWEVEMDGSLISAVPPSQTEIDPEEIDAVEIRIR